MSVGEMTVDVMANYKEVKLTSKEVSELTSFNERFFNLITSCVNYSANSEGGGKDYFVVPIKTGESDVFIDMDTVIASSSLDADKPSNAKRLKLNVSTETYHGSIVKPWYRGCEDKVYIVTKVCSDLSGSDLFPGQNQSYAERFTKEYDVSILRPELPLLEVKSLPKKINCLLKRRDVKNLISRSNEHLLPELCVQLPMSGALWIKGSMMPSILYRLERILIAEELRQTIASKSGLGISEVPLDFEWKALEEEKVIEKMEVNDVDGPSRISETNKDKPTEKRYPLFQNPEEQDINYLEGYYSLLNLKSAIVLDTEENEYESVPEVYVPRQNLLRPGGAPEGIEQAKIFSALTAPSANDLVNYERLETLGDSFLKVAVTLFLYEACPLKSEGILSDLKVRFLGNRNLFCCALSKNLPELMAVSNNAQSTDWLPPNFSLREISKTNEDSTCQNGGVDVVVKFSSLSKPKLVSLDDLMNEGAHFFGTQKITDKTIADCVEALIGASLVDCGWNGALDLLVWLQVLPENVNRPNKPSIPLKRLLENGFLKPFSDADSLIQPAEVKNMQQLIRYNFKDPEILRQALTHPSFDPQNSYERLEFVGDAVLDFLITTYIYENCGLLTPGQLTDLRSALVNNITFAALTVKYGLNRFMLTNSPSLLQCVDAFIKGRKDSDHVIDSDVLILCEEEEIRISQAVTVPKALADLFEALAGAIFFDSGRDLNAVWTVFYPLMQDVIESFCKNIPIEPVRKLYESVPKVEFEYNMDGKNHKTIATCTVMLREETRRYHGYGVNKKMAKRAAAKFALHSLKKAGKLCQI